MAPNSTKWRVHYPFESRWYSLGEHRLHYVDEGRGASVVFVHGNPTWSFFWRRMLTALRDGYRVVALDHLGMGLSDRPRRYDYSLAQHSRNLAELLDHLEITDATLVGHDWGGAIGLHCAVMHRPESFSQFVLSNTGAFPPPRIPRRIRFCRNSIWGRCLVQGANVFPRAALRMALFRRQSLASDERQGVLAPYGTWRQRLGIYRFIRDIPTSRWHPTMKQLELLESRLVHLRDRPVLLLWGMNDWCFDAACLERFQGHFPNATVVQIENAGHWVVEDAPAEYLAALKGFLQQHAFLPAARGQRPQEATRKMQV